MNPISLLFNNPRLFFWKVRVKCLHYWCSSFSRFPFYVQGKMDLEPSSLWHNPEFVKGSGGFFLPNDPIQRQILNLEPWDCTRRDMIVLLLRSLVERRIEGEMAELGVYRGSTARLIHYYMPERKLHLFDTFSGFDARDVEREKATTGLVTDRAGFSNTNVEAVLKNIHKLNDNIEVHPGFFPDSVSEPLRQKKFAFVHLDADLYDPIMAGLQFFYDRTTPGGFILVHDFNSWPGARKAVTEFFKGKPETPIPMPDKSGSTVITKLSNKV